MKKLICILLILAIFLPIYAMADSNASEHKITINGVNVVFTNGKTVLEPIENDGILYVPLESFLKAMNIDYKVENNEFIISTATAEPTSTPTPKPTATPKPKSPYEKLPKQSKEFLDLFLKQVSHFYDPGSLSIIEVWKGKDEYEGGYFVKVTAANRLGGKVQEWYYFKDWQFYKQAIDQHHAEKQKLDIPSLNAALEYKLKQMGY